MVLPIGFAVTRIASAVGSSYWVAEDTGLAASMSSYGFAVKSNPSKDTVYVVIGKASGQAGEGGMCYSLDIDDPTVENYALRFRGYSSGTNDFHLGSTRNGGAQNNGAGYGVQNCFFVSDDYLYFAGEYTTSSSTDTGHPVLVIANASNGSINKAINFDDQASHNTYPSGGINGMMGRNNGDSLWLNVYRSKSDSSDTKSDYGYARVTGTAYNLYESLTTNVVANQQHQMSVPCQMSANGNHGVLLSAWGVYTNSFNLDGLNFATFVENNSRTIGYFNSQSSSYGVLSRGGVATAVNDSKDIYLAHGYVVQLFKYSDIGSDWATQRSAATDDYIFGSYAKKFSILNSGTVRFSSMQLDPSEAYLYLVYCCEDDNSIIIFKRDASDLSSVASCRITHSDSGFLTLDDGNYTKIKNVTLEVVDDDTLLLGVGAFSKMFVMKIASDLSTSGTYGNFTFATGDGSYLNSGGTPLSAPVSPSSLGYPRWQYVNGSAFTQGTSNGTGISGSNKSSTGSYSFSTSVDYFDFDPSKTDI